MSDLTNKRELKKDKNRIRKIEVGSKSVAAAPNIVSIGDPIPDIELIDSFLEQKGILHYSGEVWAGLANSPDLVLLNFNRLTFDAHRKIRAVKSKHRVPVVCLIPIEDADKVGLITSINADEYLFKPFNPQEFVCRITNLLQRHRKHDHSPTLERRGLFRRKTDQGKPHKNADRNHSKVQIDDEKKLVRLGNRSIALTPTEYRLFRLLASEAGRIFPADEIIAHLWKNRPRVSAGDVQQYIYLLRKKVEPDINNPKWVVTVKGFGYRLDVADD